MNVTDENVREVAMDVLSDTGAQDPRLVTFATWVIDNAGNANDEGKLQEALDSQRAALSQAAGEVVRLRQVIAQLVSNVDKDTLVDLILAGA